LGDETIASATDDSGGSRSSGKRSHDHGSPDKGAGQRLGRVFGTHTAQPMTEAMADLLCSLDQAANAK
jgi:hypothetical protein